MPTRPGDLPRHWWETRRYTARPNSNSFHLVKDSCYSHHPCHAERLTENEHNQYPNSWSPDGKALIFVEQSPQIRNLVTSWIDEVRRRVASAGQN